jgi:hypothetical protein
MNFGRINCRLFAQSAWITCAIWPGHRSSAKYLTTSGGASTPETPRAGSAAVGRFLPRLVPGLRTAVEGPKVRRFHVRCDGVMPGVRAEFGVAPRRAKKEISYLGRSPVPFTVTIHQWSYRDSVNHHRYRYHRQCHRRQPL